MSNLRYADTKPGGVAEYVLPSLRFAGPKALDAHGELALFVASLLFPMVLHMELNSRGGELRRIRDGSVIEHGAVVLSKYKAWRHQRPESVVIPARRE